MAATVSLGLTYDAATHIISAAYDNDGPANGYGFKEVISKDIDSPDWHMTASEVFGVRVYAQTARLPVSPGQISIDNFVAARVALALVPEPSSFVMFGFAMLGIARRRR